MDQKKITRQVDYKKEEFKREQEIMDMVRERKAKKLGQEINNSTQERSLQRNNTSSSQQYVGFNSLFLGLK